MSDPIVVKTDPGLITLSDAHRALLVDAGLELVERPSVTEDELIANAADAQALLVIAEPITERVIAALPGCRVVARFGVGLDNIELEAATRHGLQVTHVPGGSVEEVSDHALALLLALSRAIVPLNAAVHRGEWRIPSGLPPVRRLREQTVGVIGAGRIGAAFIAKVRAVCPRVLVHDPFVPDDRITALGATPAALDHLLGASDHVSIHLPLSEATRHLIGPRELSLMKPTATLINTSRGGLVDQAALTAALSAGVLGGAGLDVLEHEPPAAGDPLLAAANVLLTPHAGHYSLESGDEILRTAIDDVIAVLAGRPPRFPANEPAAHA